MEKKTKIICVIVILLTYSSVVILKPQVDPKKKTVFVKNDMSKVSFLSAYDNKGENVTVDSSRTTEEKIRYIFTTPAKIINLRLGRSVLDTEPNRIRLNVILFSHASVVVKFTVVKVLNTHPKLNETKEKFQSFPVNDSYLVPIRVWNLKGKRNEPMRHHDRIEVHCTNLDGQQKEGALFGIEITNFRYVYYKKGKRGKAVPLRAQEILLALLVLLIIVFPFLVWLVTGKISGKW